MGRAAARCQEPSCSNPPIAWETRTASPPWRHLQWLRTRLSLSQRRIDARSVPSAYDGAPADASIARPRSGKTPARQFAFIPLGGAHVLAPAMLAHEERRRRPECKSSDMRPPGDTPGERGREQRLRALQDLDAEPDEGVQDGGSPERNEDEAER